MYASAPYSPEVYVAGAMRRRRGGRRRKASEQIEQSPPGEAAEPTTLEAAEGPLSSCQPAAERLGIRRLYPEQERTVAASLAGHDVLVVLPTGFGKSACYQVPSMVLPQPVVLVSPLLALLRDQHEKLLARNIPVERLDGTIRGTARRAALQRIAAGGSLLVMTTPETLAGERAGRGAAQAGRVAGGGRRGALHLRVGPRLPPRLSASRRAPARARRAADPGADGDRDAERPRRHRALPRHARPRGRRRLAAPRQPGLRGHGDRRRRPPARHGALRQAPASAGHHLLRDDQGGRRPVRRAATAAHAGAPLPRPHGGEGTQRGAGAVHEATAGARSWWRPAPSVSASTSRTSATSCTTSRRRRSSSTCRRPGAPAATGGAPTASCSTIRRIARFTRRCCRRSRVRPDQLYRLAAALAAWAGEGRVPNLEALALVGATRRAAGEGAARGARRGRPGRPSTTTASASPRPAVGVRRAGAQPRRAVPDPAHAGRPATRPARRVRPHEGVPRRSSCGVTSARRPVSRAGCATSAAARRNARRPSGSRLPARKARNAANAGAAAGAVVAAVPFPLQRRVQRQTAEERFPPELRRAPHLPASSALQRTGRTTTSLPQ